MNKLYLILTADEFCLSTSEDIHGTHWIAISNQGNQNLEVFDSLGIRNYGKLYQKYMKVESIEINQHPVQEPTSSTCAQFVIYYSEIVSLA